MREAEPPPDVESAPATTHELRSALAALGAWIAVLRRVGAEPGARARALESLQRTLGTVVRLVDTLEQDGSGSRRDRVAWR